VAQQDSVAWGQVNEALPSPIAENTQGPVRLNRYREQMARPSYSGQWGPAEDGQYFVATNPTPDTAVVHATSAAVSETAGYYFVLRNADSPSNPNAKRIMLDYVRLISKVVPAASTRSDFFIKVGPGTRWASGGSLLVPQNVNSVFANNSIALPYIGALVTVADPASRLLCRGVMRGVIQVALDEFIFKTGTVDPAGALSLGGTVPQRMMIPLPPIIIAPGHSLGLQLWHASNNAAAQYEFEAGWWER
jgi:hypothetical protein